MKLPKLAKGGIIIQDNLIFVPNKRMKPAVDILGKKYFDIYNRTKNRRIKKKQIKKCPMLELRLRIEKCVGLSNYHLNKNLEIYINGEQLYKEGD